MARAHGVHGNHIMGVQQESIMIFSSNTRLLQPDGGFCSMHATCKRESNTSHMIPSGARQHQTSQTWKRRNLREEIFGGVFCGLVGAGE